MAPFSNVVAGIVVTHLRLAETLHLFNDDRSSIDVFESVSQKLPEQEKAQQPVARFLRGEESAAVSSGADNLCLQGHLVPEFYVMGSSTAAILSFTEQFKTSRGVSIFTPTWDEPNWKKLTPSPFVGNLTELNPTVWAVQYPRCNHDQRLVAVDNTLDNFAPQVPKKMWDVYNAFGNAPGKLRFLVILQEPAQRMREIFVNRLSKSCTHEPNQRPSSLKDAVDLFLSKDGGNCTCGCLDVEHVDYVSALKSYFQYFDPSRFYVAPIYDGASDAQPLSIKMWQAFGLPLGEIKPPAAVEFLRTTSSNFPDRTPLEEALDIHVVHQLRDALEPYGGPTAVAKVLHNTGAHLHAYGEAAKTACKITGWISRTWGRLRELVGLGDDCKDKDDDAPEVVRQGDAKKMVEDEDDESQDGLKVEERGHHNLCIDGILAPEFFLLGAPKSSTTTFVEAFGSSPGVVFYTPSGGEEEWQAKEPWVFSSKQVDKNGWLKHYPKCNEEVRQVAIDCTPGYFGIDHSPKSIHSVYAPGRNAGLLTFMVLLREPIRRFQSHFYHHQARKECGDELPKTFADAVTNFLDTGKSCDCDCEDVMHSMYAEAFARYFEYFSPAQFTVAPFEVALDGSAMKLATMTWSMLGLPGGTGKLKDDSVVGHIGQNHHAYPDLAHDLETESLVSLLEGFRKRTGPMKVAEQLVDSGAHLYMYAGSASDQCGIAKWLAAGWGESEDKSSPCSTD